MKKLNALLFDQSKNRNAKHYCLLCLTAFSRADLLVEHEKYCNGVEGRPTRTDMPEEGKNWLFYQNYKRQMKKPYVIYGDTESLNRKIPRCERRPESKQKSYTEKTAWHESCGFAYKVRCDGEATGSNVFRGENAMGNFF